MNTETISTFYVIFLLLVLIFICIFAIKYVNGDFIVNKIDLLSEDLIPYKDKLGNLYNMKVYTYRYT